jgi:hypothetical protein
MKQLIILLALAVALSAQSVYPPNGGGGGGGGGTPGSPVGGVQVNVAGSFGADASFVANFSALSAPAAPTLTKVGAGTGTTWGYKLSACVSGGSPCALGTETGSEATIDGNASLDMTHSITITPPACSGNIQSFDVWRTTGSPVGLIGNVACASTLSDTGLPRVVPYQFDPGSNFSVGVGSTIPFINTNINSAFGCIAQSGEDSNFPLTDAATGLGVYMKSSCPGADFITFLAYVENDVDTFSNAIHADIVIETDKTTQSTVINGQLFQSGKAINSNYQTVFGTNLSLNGAISGTTKVVGMYNQSNPHQGYSDSSGVINAGVWDELNITLISGSVNVSNRHGYHFGTPFLDMGASITNQMAVWVEALGGTATNSYSFWSDEDGVFRIKADNTFDSVYQAIPALYNPQFTKYTPGAANYERIVEEWNGNVAEIGAQNGGTGTLRGLKLLGATLAVPVTTGAATGKHVLCVDNSTKIIYESSTGTDCSN